MPRVGRRAVIIDFITFSHKNQIISENIDKHIMQIIYKKIRTCFTKVRISNVLVCPPGLEPGPKASEAFMVSNSTTGTRANTFIRVFARLL